MGGVFGVASRNDCVMDLYFGTDYHSHLGSSRGGMAVFSGSGFPGTYTISKISSSEQNSRAILLRCPGTWGSGA